MKESLKIGIAGATGYIGLELIKILTKHPKVKIIYLCAQKSIGKKINKFDKNIKRDIKKEKELLDLGWIVLVFWECKIKTNMKDCTNKIKAILKCH